MNDILNQVFVLIIVSIIITSILSMLSIHAAPYVNLIDSPGSESHKIHQHPTPVTGGIILLIALILMFWIYLQLSNDLTRSTFYMTGKPILIGSCFVFMFGLWDDIKRLPAWIKLFGQIIAAIVMINMGVQIHIFNSPEFIFRTETMLDNWLNIGITLLWILLLTNAFNFIDSIDGLAIGLASLSIIYFLIISIVGIQADLAYFCAILLGISLVIYFFP